MATAQTAGVQLLDAGHGYGRACAAGAAAAPQSRDVIAFMDSAGADCADQLARLFIPVLDSTQDFTFARIASARAQP